MRLAHHHHQQRIGFALKVFEIEDTIELSQKILMQSLLEQSMRPGDKKNFFSISRIATNILENGKFIRELNVDAPYLAHMKAELDRLRNNQKTDTQKDKTRELPESALTIPFNSIAGKVVEPPNDESEVF